MLILKFICGTTKAFANGKELAYAGDTGEQIKTFKDRFTSLNPINIGFAPMLLVYWEE